MGLFGKKKKEEKKIDFPPTLPELPKLPEFPGMEEDVVRPKKPEQQLPSFLPSDLTDKFSRNNIKKAVTGKKEGEEVFDRDDFADGDEMRMMQKPLKKPLTMEIGEEFKYKQRSKKIEPVFIRIDKFEESLHLFEKTKKQIGEIEKILKDTRRVREEEEKELEFWGNEMQKIKNQIEKVDRDIFSKIE